MNQVSSTAAHVGLPRNFLLNKPGASESYPFYPDVPVFKVVNKIFAIGFSKHDNWFLNLKTKPEDGALLCSLFSAITPGYHMNKRHWISVDLAGDLPAWEIERLINTSYDLVVAGFSKKQRLQLIGASGD
ncbi:MAG TPA: MmcQ/YjbR family DNA-binding protein [Cellvibrionaceae bacterium]|nr:MmcQ/YjbR family DNA-binding protein [Cellvibrionaceae bacterium]HMW73586.1 MmcQ/YjbR family DNA-binding protein [Cellvibrionaceae bacterium]HNG61166.1 MmcQ/YjbR family DNA-binding protein [Cellvibrionaceae bacterium]